MSIDRIGQGYDLHRLVPDRALILGGVRIPFAKGLMGHSDADVLTHAVIDALLGAMSMGDIGTLFPDTDTRYRGADSMTLLRTVMSILCERGYRVVQCDCTVICENPKLGPYKAAIGASLAAALDVAPQDVNVKAKTNEGVDAVGRGEAIAALAVVGLMVRE